MYLVKYFDAEVGDLIDVKPAASFNDGIADVLRTIGTSPDYVVSASWIDGIGSLDVQRKNITIAVIEDVQPAVGNDSEEVASACKSFEQGNGSSLFELFIEP